MAFHPLLFGHAEWPDPDPAGERVLPRPDCSNGRLARVTVRLPETLRSRVEASAALEGLAPDTWIVRTLSRSVDPRLEVS